MELISIGNVILNLDQISALDIHEDENGVLVLRVLTDSATPIINVNLAAQVPDLLLNLVPHKMRFIGAEAVLP
jgi:hypothetical protein